MKKVSVLIVLLMVVMMFGCSNSASDTTNCRQSVVNMYPKAKVFNANGPYYFVVIDGKYVRFVKTMGMTHPGITSDVIIGVIE